MSLLLLFPSISTGTSTGGFSCWMKVGAPSDVWTLSHYDLKNLWSEWATMTWAQIQASGYTWEGMAGRTFLVVSSSATPWGNVNVSTCGGI